MKGCIEMKLIFGYIKFDHAAVGWIYDCDFMPQIEDEYEIEIKERRAYVIPDNINVCDIDDYIKSYTSDSVRFLENADSFFFFNGKYMSYNEINNFDYGHGQKLKRIDLSDDEIEKYLLKHTYYMSEVVGKNALSNAEKFFAWSIDDAKRKAKKRQSRYGTILHLGGNADDVDDKGRLAKWFAYCDDKGWHDCDYAIDNDFLY